MTNDELVSMLQRLNAAGLRRLLTALGFAGALRAGPRPKALPKQVRAVHTVRRDTLSAFVVRCRGACRGADLRQTARALSEADPLSHQLLLVLEPHGRRVIFACDALATGLRFLAIEPAHMRPSDVEALRELLPRAGEGDTAAALRIVKALDRSRVTDRFFRDVAACRDLVSRSWTGLPADAQSERDALALLLISRLLFLYFLQRRGLLANDHAFLPRLFAECQRAGGASRSFHATTLRTLFFGALNRRPGQRSA
ncbi:MAG: hypothetical protein WEF86_16305, partial [Gemmatimonadota bacterium]